MYTTDDIEMETVEYEVERWNSSKSRYDYSKAQAICFKTKDGKYTTGKPDGQSFSYWHDKWDGTRLGNPLTDYVLGTLTLNNLEYVTKKLNNLIERYEV